MIFLRHSLQPGCSRSTLCTPTHLPWTPHVPAIYGLNYGYSYLKCAPDAHLALPMRRCFVPRHLTLLGLELHGYVEQVSSFRHTSQLVPQGCCPRLSSSSRPTWTISTIHACTPLHSQATPSSADHMPCLLRNRSTTFHP